MKKALLYIVLIIYTSISFFYKINVYLNTFIWFIFVTYSFLFIKNYKRKARNLINRLQVLFIIITIYLIIYFLLGLITGYNKSIYNHSFIGIISNIYIYILPAIFKEYIRTSLVNKNKFNFLFAIILFTISDLNINSFITSDKSLIFNRIFEIGLTMFARNTFLTFLACTSGFLCNLMYLMPLLLFQLIIPIFPSFNWYINSVLNIILPFISFIILNNLDIKSTNRISKRRVKTNSMVRYIPTVILVSFIFMFMLGIFKYQIIAIMSNSMNPIYYRGDAVIVEKISSISDLKVDDIIEYKINDIYVLHRIVAIEQYNNGNVLYITKGDSNTNIDKEKVKFSQIIGIVRVVIPKLGYPSVLLNEYFNKGENM